MAVVYAYEWSSFIGNTEQVDSRKELLENKKKLQFIGELPSEIDVMPMAFNPDGSVTAIRPQDEVHERNINTGIQKLKKSNFTMKLEEEGAFYYVLN